MPEAAARIVATDAALDAIERLTAKHGALMLFQSGGCCDGSSPLCLHAGELLTGPNDLLLGELGGDLEDGYYFEPTVFKGDNTMRIFQEEIFGPVLAVTTFKDKAEALEIANDTLYGLGAGVWTRDAHEMYEVPRAIQAGRVWVNCYHDYPAGAPFGGYKASGFGRENHKMMLSHYRQNKNMLISYSQKPLGFF